MALKEVCVAVVNRGRVQEGDILDVRDPIGGVGVSAAETQWVVWLLMDESEVPAREALKSADDPSNNKYRYQLPLAALKSALPALDLDRLRDADDAYQPFVDSDPQTRRHRRQQRHSAPGAAIRKPGNPVGRRKRGSAR